jgi:hypothetical protein
MMQLKGEGFVAAPVGNNRIFLERIFFAGRQPSVKTGHFQESKNCFVALGERSVHCGMLNCRMSSKRSSIKNSSSHANPLL